MYTPSVCYLDEWFIERKDFAFGMMYAGTGIGGVVLPFSLSAALSVYPFRTVLRAYGVCLFIALMPLIWFISPRLPASPVSRPSKFDFLRSPHLAIFQLGNFLQALGLFLPPLYLPTYASELGATTTIATLSVVLFNVASVVGCVLMGILIDKVNVTTCIAISSIGSTLSILTHWGMAPTADVVLAFALLYGLFAGSFSSTWPGIMRTAQQKFPAASGTMVFAFLAAGRGLGNILSGPFSQHLIRQTITDRLPSGGYSSSYMPMIIFTGISAYLGGVAFFSGLVR